MPRLADANHEQIGRAIAESRVPRAALFLADKISFPGSYSRAGVEKVARPQVDEGRGGAGRVSFGPLAVRSSSYLPSLPCAVERSMARYGTIRHDE